MQVTLLAKEALGQPELAATSDARLQAALGHAGKGEIVQTGQLLQCLGTVHPAYISVPAHNPTQLSAQAITSYALETSHIAISITAGHDSQHPLSQQILDMQLVLLDTCTCCCAWQAKAVPMARSILSKITCCKNASDHMGMVQASLQGAWMWWRTKPSWPACWRLRRAGGDCWNSDSALLKQKRTSSGTHLSLTSA